VRDARFVLNIREFFQLWHRYAQSRLNFCKPCLSRPLGSSGHLLKKTSAVGIPRDSLSRECLRVAKELWDQMEVAYRIKKPTQLPKLSVRINLLEMGLGKAQIIFLIFSRRLNRVACCLVVPA
jgi:hypothetical protein